MDFKKRIIEELKLTELQANTLLKDYIETCEKLAKEYHKEQCNLTDVGRTNLTDKHPIEGVNCFMQTESEDEDDELVCRSCKTGIDEDEGRFGYCWNCYEN